MTENKIGEDIAVIKTEIKNIKESIIRMEVVTKASCDRIDALEDKQIALAIKVSNMGIFQATLTTIIGGIATYLGAKLK
jgi:hypothetical protein